jgi:flagellar protein FlaJ
MNEINEILDLIDECETQLRYKRKLVLAVTQIEKEYQAKKYTYSQYNEKLKRMLRGKTLKEWVEYYNAYVLSVLERIKYLNTQVFYHIYHDDRIEKKLAEAVQEAPAKPAEKIKPVEIEHPAKLERPKLRHRIFGKPAQKPVEIAEKKAIPAIKEKKQLSRPLPTLQEIKPEPEKPSKPFKIKKERKPLLKIFARKTEPEKAEIEYLKKEIEKPMPKPILKIKADKLKKKAAAIEKKPGEQQYFTAYTPSPFGTLANRYFRGIGEFILDKYPESFEKLFKAMRYANMRILSKTYVNIVLLVTFLAFVVSFLVIMLFGFINISIYTIALRPLIVSLLFAIAAFTATYSYPFVKADQRSKFIDANLPFAINHMSAVANSGLPPDMMFRIVSQSKEYKEIGVELRKLVEFIDLFGYDLTTAIQSISATTPSRDLKEFLDGALATLTSGGDFGLFLKEKADQSMFAYKLRMEKYNETVSTYSDVYMGIMIVAPVFFIAILSLVSILGGKILGLDIQTVIVLGTYAIIPMLNVAFILFLEVSQPIE